MGNTSIESPEYRFRSWFFEGRPDDCWPWFGGTVDGYGSFGINSKTFKAHRFSYEYYKGKITDELCVLHTCDNRICVNPNHLFLGTHLDNIADRNSKNHQAKGVRNGNAFLTEQVVLAIRKEYIKFSSTKGSIALAAKYGIGQTTVISIVTRKIWRHI